MLQSQLVACGCLFQPFSRTHIFEEGDSRLHPYFSGGYKNFKLFCTNQKWRGRLFGLYCHTAIAIMLMTKSSIEKSHATKLISSGAKHRSAAAFALVGLSIRASGSTQTQETRPSDSGASCAFSTLTPCHSIIPNPLTQQD